MQAADGPTPLGAVGGRVGGVVGSVVAWAARLEDNLRPLHPGGMCL